jgi:Transposase DDE domain group 1
MPTQCSPSLFEFARAEGRDVIASFDAGAMTSDAGALLLGATDRVLSLIRRLAACFKDSRDPVCVEHAVETLVMQRVSAIALGYERSQRP